MSAVLSLALLQTVVFNGTVPEPNRELDAANACLVATTDAWLSEYDWQPDEAERWRWATSIVDRCSVELNVAADSAEAVQISAYYQTLGLTRRNVLRTEASYYVDRLIREHFEAQS